MHSFQSVLQQHPAAGLQRADHTDRLPSNGGIAAEAEGLQVAEVVRAALVLGDVTPISGPPPGPFGAGFAKQQPAPQHSQRPLARVSPRYLIEPLIGVRWRFLCPKPQASA